MGGLNGSNCPRYPINTELIANLCQLANITKPQDTRKGIAAENAVVHNINYKKGTITDYHNDVLHFLCVYSVRIHSYVGTSIQTCR